MTSQCVQFTFRDKGEVYLCDESDGKESEQEGKIHIGSRMKNGHANRNGAISDSKINCFLH